MIMAIHKHSRVTLAVAVCALMLAGCQSVRHWQPNAGPTTKQITKSPNVVVAPKNTDAHNYGLAVIDIDMHVANQLRRTKISPLFSRHFVDAPRIAQTIAAGDVVDISIWEAPPALLFGAANLGGFSGSQEAKLPEQMVDSSGQISVPFVGKIKVVGKTPQQVQDMIVAGLHKKANKPSAIVRIVKNNTADVTIIGEVNNSTRMPLTGKGERVLDAIAAAGGSKQAAERVSVQLTRQGQTVEMLLSDIINDASQNIRLQQGDVLSVKYKTNSYMVLGATAKNDEIDFEAKGISLMQALARAGGLNDGRADAQGVFVFRYEYAQMLSPEQLASVPEQFRQAQVPVVYRLDLEDPLNYIIARDFEVRNQDVIYVSNAPAVEFSKFLNMISQSVYSITNIRNL